MKIGAGDVWGNDGNEVNMEANKVRKDVMKRREEAKRGRRMDDRQFRRRPLCARKG